VNPFLSLANPNCPDCLTRTGDTPAGDVVVCPDCGQSQQWNPERGAWGPVSNY